MWWQGLAPWILFYLPRSCPNITLLLYISSFLFRMCFFLPFISRFVLVDILDSLPFSVWVLCHWAVYIQKAVLHQCIVIVIPWVWAHSNQWNPNTTHQQSQRVHNRNGRICNKEQTHLLARNKTQYYPTLTSVKSIGQHILFLEEHKVMALVMSIHLFPFLPKA